MSNDLLLEIGTEELPSAAVLPLSEALAANLVAGLSKAKLKHGSVRSFASPRRLAVYIQDVQAEQASQQISRRGPACSVAMDAMGKPTPALIGFAKSCGVSFADLTTTKTDKGDWWVYEALEKGAHSRDLLPALVSEAIAGLAIAKPMRWGSGDVQFARPVHWVLLLLGKEVVKANILGVATGGHSYGHRFHHPQAVEIPSPSAYESCLKEAFVIADFNTRRQLIIQQVQQLAKDHHYLPVMPESLVNEVTSIVEWPQALEASFEREFLEVPAEALIAAMQAHQKCFALRDSQGQLLPHFITVANIVSKQAKQVVLGNEKVMRARLSDAAFFFRQDKRQALSHYYPATANVVFQLKLGSLQDKMMRMQTLMAELVQALQLDETEALRAAELSKCDLMTGMVGEFPELQGLMGYYYALHDGESNAVAQALNEQYMPRFAADELPQSTLGLALSLVDRLDTLVGTFAIGQKPTGVKDPFKLRRHALAIVRLLIASPAALNLSTLINDCLRVYGDGLSIVDGAVAEIKPFILERLQSFYQGQGITPEFVHAARARQDDWLFDMDKRIKALLNFAKLPAAISLSAACKRVKNLLNQTAISAKKRMEVNPDLFEEPAEKALFEQMKKVEHSVDSLYSAGEYGTILSQLASLREPVDIFFEQVMVMVDNQNLKNNRIALLARLQDLLQGVADISLLQLGL